ncbi:single-stranded DNA-binding protein [Falsigemmobacter intermedius]|uniref:Single-stranded DNA-binding protein n=1 Tax=Falsigemmobacter intermedius TaxID=1553448 RepID=A0A3S3Y7N0_9RHOB|nr:single-stranded DNA-binding protein [Falsigemmobacter intermedius]RWY38793.1 single-stranded DNA-binding protein [Falsigemmobacter intermedius]
MAGSLNKVQLIGYLGKDPETRTFQDGSKVVNLRVATSETWRDKNTGEPRERTEWHSVAVYNEALQKIAEQYMRKGELVYVEGQLETRKWQDQSGADRYSNEVTVRSFRSALEMLGSKGSQNGNQTGGGASGGSYGSNGGDTGYNGDFGQGGGQNARGGQQQRQAQHQQGGQQQRNSGPQGGYQQGNGGHGPSYQSNAY